MLVESVATLYRLMLDDSDPTWVDDAQITLALSLGYNEFRRLVTTHDPYFYATRVNIAPSAASYALDGAEAVILMGDPTTVVLTGARLSSLLRVADVDASNAVSYFMGGAGSWDELRRFGRRYLLESQTLHFSEDQSGKTLRLEYVGVSGVDWTKLASGDNEWIDELDEFHDLIALLAYAQYAIRDLSSNEEVRAQLARRVTDLKMHVARGRAPQMSDHILRHRGSR